MKQYTGCSSGLAAVIMMAERHSLPRFCLKVFGDSKLVIGQVNGTKMVDKEHLEPFLAKVHQPTTALKHRQCELTFAWKRRAENKEADAQCNKAMDEKETTFARTPDFVTHMDALALGTAAHIFLSAHTETEPTVDPTRRALRERLDRMPTDEELLPTLIEMHQQSRALRALPPARLWSPHWVARWTEACQGFTPCLKAALDDGSDLAMLQCVLDLLELPHVC